MNSPNGNDAGLNAFLTKLGVFIAVMVAFAISSDCPTSALRPRDDRPNLDQASNPAQGYGDRLLSLDPDSAEAYFEQGVVDGRKGDFERAIANFTQALKLKPGYADAYHKRGTAYYYKQDYGNAIADYTQALKLKPDLAEAYIEEAVLTRRSKTMTTRSLTIPKPSSSNPI